MSAGLLGLLLATDRNGALAGRLEISRWPVTVGRSLGADLPLDDSHVAAEHLRIGRNAEGEVRVEVLDTGNGVNLGKLRHGRGSEFAWPTGQTLQLGRLKFSLRLADEPVAAEEPLPLFPWRGLGWTALALFGMLALVFGQAWLSMTEPAQLAREAPGLLATVSAGIAVWAGLWALATKLFAHRLAFWRHVRIACFSALAIQLAALLLNLLGFMFSLESLARFSLQLTLLGLAVTVYFHLGTIAPQRRRGLAALVAGLALLAIVVTTGTSWLQNKRLSNTLYMTAIFPPSWRIAPAVPVQQFVGEAGALRARLDARLKDKEGEDGAADDGDEE